MGPSDVNGGCSSQNVWVLSGTPICDSAPYTALGEETSSGVLLDGVVPIIDTTTDHTTAHIQHNRECVTWFSILNKCCTTGGGSSSVPLPTVGDKRWKY